MRLLWARALDDGLRSAIVIDTGHGSLLGGVGYLQALDIDFRPVPGMRGTSSLSMKFVWEWSRVVTSPEEFTEGREWEKRVTDTKLIAETKRIEARKQ